jgi:hypothetical protein
VPWRSILQPCLDHGSILGDDELRKALPSGNEALRRHAEDTVDLVGPDELVAVGEVTPAAHLPDLLSVGEVRLTDPELLYGTVACAAIAEPGDERGDRVEE